MEEGGGASDGGANDDYDDVVVVLDGDDWLAGPHVLAMVADAYRRTGAWMTYGTYVEYPTGLSPDWILDFPPAVVERKTFRAHPFMSSHLRTFKRFLLASVSQEEFCYDDDRGWGPECASGSRFFDRAGADVAVMLPLLERAGERIVRIPEVLHVYNIATPLNDYKVHLQEQWDVDTIVRSRSALSRLPGARKSEVPHMISLRGLQYDIEETPTLFSKINTTELTDVDFPCLARLSPAPTTPPQPTVAAAVSITAPSPGQTVEAADVHIAFSVTDVWMPEEVGVPGL